MTARYAAAAAALGRAATLMRIAYLASRYPAVSHTFIQREVAGLREHGVTIDTFAIRRAGRDEVLSRADEAEARATMRCAGALTHLLRAHLRALVRHPRGYKTTLGEALRLAPAGARGALWQGFYFGEAVLLWDRLAAAARRTCTRTSPTSPATSRCWRRSSDARRARGRARGASRCTARPSSTTCRATASPRRRARRRSWPASATSPAAR